MDKETFCKTLYGGDKFSESDNSADDLAALLRERRKKIAVNPSLSTRSRQDSGFRQSQGSKTAATHTPGPHDTTEDRSKVPSTRQEASMDASRGKRSPKGLAKAESGVDHNKKQRNGSTRHIQDDRQIFKGLVFCKWVFNLFRYRHYPGFNPLAVFVPYNDISPARRLRIKRSVEFGAYRAVEWSSSITHVIVDRGLTMRDVTKCLKMDFLPVGLHLCIWVKLTKLTNFAV